MSRMSNLRARLTRFAAPFQHFDNASADGLPASTGRHATIRMFARRRAGCQPVRQSGTTSAFDPKTISSIPTGLGEGELVLSRDRQEALPVAHNGVENIAALLTDTRSAGQLQMIAARMDKRGCETVEIL